MITLTTTVQEITLQAYAFGVYEHLFNAEDMSRDEIFNLFEEWGIEFELTHKDYPWEGDYYYEVDKFVEMKMEVMKAVARIHGEIIEFKKPTIY